MLTFIQLMNIAQWIIIVGLVFAVAYIFRKSYEVIEANSSFNDDIETSNFEIGSTYPNLNLMSVNNKMISLKNKEFDGTILLFSVQGCSGCENLYPELDSISKHFSSYQVVSTMVAPLTYAMSKVEKYNLALPVHQIGISDMSKYGTNSFPFCFILSSGGEIINKGSIQDKEGVIDLINRDNKESYTVSTESRSKQGRMTS